VNLRLAGRARAWTKVEGGNAAEAAAALAADDRARLQESWATCCSRS